MKKIYISPSLQPGNAYVAGLGNEESRMHELGKLLIEKLKRHSEFEVEVNTLGTTLETAVAASNAWGADIHVALHSNASADPLVGGTEIYYHNGSTAGMKLAETIYQEIAPISPGKDRGILNDVILYQNGLYELKKTNCPSILIEYIYHTNKVEVDDLLKRMDAYAEGTYHGICKYLGVTPLEPPKPLFMDIAGHFAEASIIQANKLGLVSGYPDGSFKPNNTITRGEIVTIVMKLYKLLNK